MRDAFDDSRNFFWGFLDLFFAMVMGLSGPDTLDLHWSGVGGYVDGF